MPSLPLSPLLAGQPLARAGGCRAQLRLVVLVGCGGGGATPRRRDLPRSAPRRRRPRHLAAADLERLPAPDPARAPGRSAAQRQIVASLTEYAGGQLQAGFHASSDDGASSRAAARWPTHGFATGLCCGTLFELPQAVGALPAGTLLYAASVGADTPGALMDAARSIAATMRGATFVRVGDATCGRSAVPRIAGARRLGRVGAGVPRRRRRCSGLHLFRRDRTRRVAGPRADRDPRRHAWSTPRAHRRRRVGERSAGHGDRPPPAERPLCDELRALQHRPPRLRGAAHSLRRRPDWGAAGSIGTRPQTAAGQYFRHAPTIAWSAPPGPAHGALSLIGQILASDSTAPTCRATAGRCSSATLSRPAALAHRHRADRPGDRAA